MKLRLGLISLTLAIWLIQPIPGMSATISGFVGDSTALVPPHLACTSTGHENHSTASTPGAYAKPCAASAPSNSRYRVLDLSDTLSAQTSVITVTASSPPAITYGQLAPAITYTYSGFVNGDTASVITGTPVCTSTAAGLNPLPVGPYTTHCDVSGLSAANYTFQAVNGVLNVVSEPLYVTASSATITVGQPIPAITAAVTGFVNGDTRASLPSQPVCSTAAGAPGATAGTLGTYPTSCSGGAVPNDNYRFVYVGGTLTVGKPVIRVTASSPPALTYGQLAPAITYAYSGFVNGDTASVITGTPVCTSTAAGLNPLRVGTYTTHCDVSGLSAANYTFQAVNGVLNVVSEPLSVTASSPTITVGQPIPAIAATVTGFVYGDTVASLPSQPVCATSAGATGATAGTAGSYPTSCSGGAVPNDNYRFVYVGGTLTVGKPVIRVTASSPPALTYGQLAPAITYTYSGFVNGDTASVITGTPVCTSTAAGLNPLRVGTYTTHCDVSGLSAANYTFQSVDGTLTVNRAPLTVYAANATATYGGTVPVIGALYSGFVNGDTSAVLTTQPTCGAPIAGLPGATIMSAGSFVTSCAGGSAANYIITSYVAGTLTVNRATLTVYAASSTATYGGTVPIIPATITGFVNGDTAGVLTSQPTCISTAGSTGTVLSNTGSFATSCTGGAAANYTIATYVTGTLTVAPAPLTITASSPTIFYEQAVPPIDALYAGLVNGDTPATMGTDGNTAPTCTPPGGITVGQQLAEGSYPGTTCSGAVNPHYSITYASGVITVEAMHPGLQPDGSTLLLNGRTVTPAGNQVPLQELPLNAVLSPNGRNLLITDDGRRTQFIQVVSVSTGAVIQTIPYPYPSGLFVGVAYSQDGSMAYASGGGQNVIHAFKVLPTGELLPEADVPLTTSPLSNPYPAGMTTIEGRPVLAVAEESDNRVAFVNPTTGAMVSKTLVGLNPYDVVYDPNSGQLFVSNWSSASVSVLSVETHHVTTTIPVGAHPSAMVLGPDGMLYVADSNADEVSIISIATDTVVGTIPVGPYTGALLGSSPEGLAVSADGHFLYVANSGENAVVVVSLRNYGTSGIAVGRIPTAIYPTSVTLTADGRRLFVTNGTVTVPRRMLVMASTTRIPSRAHCPTFRFPRQQV